MNIILFLDVVTIIILLIVSFLCFRYSNAIKKNVRISYYSISPIVDNSLSLSDILIKKYLEFIARMRPFINKSSILKNSSRKYEKYIKYKNHNNMEVVDFITNKFVIAGLFVLIAILSQVFSLKTFSIFGIIINYLLGYYLLDIYLYFNYKREVKLIKNELLRAIIIMNNAFKAGKSTLQALKIAGDELPYPISDEFKKMYLDMKYGLSVDVVFDRFAKRVNLEEAVYLSSSLTILNKTGGNIVEVFSSIERTLFDKKKLNEELKNIASSPKMVVKVLLFVPVVFVFMIYVLNPNYFAPLFSSILGYIIIAIIVIMFMIYIILLKRILKIEV